LKRRGNGFECKGCGQYVPAQVSKEAQHMTPMQNFEEQCRTAAESLLLSGKAVPDGFDRNRVVAIEIFYLVGDERRSHTLHIPARDVRG
jgi:hypothetical protein